MALPFVTLHFAQSLDGRLALGPAHERALLSTEEGVRRAHRARAEHDAVLIGIGTLRADDPLLTLRGVPGAQPLRVVLDSSLSMPTSARLLGAEKPAGRVIVFGVSDRASAERHRLLEMAGAEVCLTAGCVDGRVALSEALEALHARGVERLLVEGGARVLTSFLRAGLARRAQIEIALLCLGGSATASIGDLGVGELGHAVRLERSEVEHVGQSVFVRGDIAYPRRSES